MAKVPNKEAEFMALAATAFQGFNEHLDVFPDVPVGATEFGPLMSQYNAQKAAIGNAEQALKLAVAEKQRILEQLRLDLIRNLRYAERVTKNDPTKLSFIGWAPRKAPEPIAAPGTPASISAAAQDRGAVNLNWTRTAVQGCGAPSFYVIERRILAPGAITVWTNLCSTMDREITLTNQPTDVEVLYRVFARNSAGVSAPTTTVSVVL